MKASTPTLFSERPWDGGNYALLATPIEMNMPTRMIVCTKTHGVDLVGELVQLTQAELLSWPNMGRKSLHETEAILAEHGLRLGMYLAGWDKVAASQERGRLGRNLLRRLAARKGTGSNPAPSLSAELQALIASVETGRNVPLLVSLYGFDGSEPKTLEAVGQAYGLTRERVRQIGDRAKGRLSSKWLDTPHLASAIECVKRIGPAGRSTIAAELERRGIEPGYFSAESILEAAELVSLDGGIARYTIGEDELFGPEESRSLARTCVQNLRKSTSKSGCTSVERLALEAQLPIGEADRVRSILDAFSETVWLDASKTWAASTRPTRNRLVNVACKVFGVTSQINAGELRRALSRPHRVQYVPPLEALSQLLEYKGVAKRSGELLIHAHDPCPTMLSGIESVLLEGFQTLGNPLSREALEEFCIDERGLNPTSFYIYLSYSPIVTKLMPGIYSLIGTDVAPGSAETIRTAQLEARRSAEHGWTPKGQLWLLLPLDRLAINAASRLVPAYIADIAVGSWNCLVSGGLSAGEVTIHNGFLGGLRGAFTLLAPEPTDFLLLSFDLQSRQVTAAVGGPELKDALGENVEPLEDDEEPDEEELDYLDVEEG